MDKVEFAGFIISSLVLIILGILLQFALIGFDLEMNSRIWLLDLFWLTVGIFQTSFWLSMR